MSLVQYLILPAVFLLITGCSPPRGVYHTVQKGQTIYQIARSYDVEPDRLLRVNRISDPTRLAIGDRLFIPGASRPIQVPATLVETQPVRPITVQPQAAPTGEKVADRPKPAAEAPRGPVAKKAPPPSKNSASPVARKGFFHWPVKGEVVKRFSGNAENRGGNGIEIATRQGTEVQSSAAGKVIYSGNGIAGFGNLVIIEHDGSFYTVYGFNQKNLVEAGSFVSQGQRIALSGIPPRGGVPRLYFEIRSGKVPRDPIFYLP